ncbi:MAG: NADH-quinone oxidoreductase subunit K [Desulfotignum sp.]|jgi:multisubunit Na+/H+ antiporter MnhC subunit|nr:NADH-quinone oxidoreductase subunit K [Desulfotignum sp.]
MEFFLAIVVGLVISAAFFLMLSGVLIRFVFGLILMGNAVNLLIFTAGRLAPVHPPLIGAQQTLLTAPAANALPQALILTAIVIGFAMTIFMLILLFRTHDQTRTLDADQERFIFETDKNELPEISGQKEQE